MWQPDSCTPYVRSYKWACVKWTDASLQDLVVSFTASKNKFDDLIRLMNPKVFEASTSQAGEQEARKDVNNDVEKDASEDNVEFGNDSNNEEEYDFVSFSDYE